VKKLNLCDEAAALKTPLALKKPPRSNPAAGLQPWRCLWRGLLQTTYTTPWRRTILQFSQIRLTLARTFMALSTTARFPHLIESV